MPELRTVTCTACGGEGRDLRGHPNDPHPSDYGPCTVCKGDRVVEIEVRPIEMWDLERQRPTKDEAMLIARMIVEAHINTWGYIPHPDYLKESITASLVKAANTGSLSWSQP